MAITIHCFEPTGSPRQASLDLEEGAGFSVYSMQDNLPEDAKTLRNTILRRSGFFPPPNSTLLMHVELRSQRPGELPVMRVTKVGAGVILEVIRPDSRGRVTKGTDLRSGSRLEATMRDLRTILYSLEVESELVKGSKAAVGGSRPTGSQAAEGLMNAIWIVPTVAETLLEPRAKLMTWLSTKARAMGLSPAMLQPMMLASAGTFIMAYIAYDQYSDNSATQDRLTELQLQYEAAGAARDQAIQAEVDCREQRKVLAGKLDEIEVMRSLQAEIALASPLAQAVSVELGGPRMQGDEVAEFDRLSMAQIHKLVVADMGNRREPLNMAALCLGQETALHQDLPRYVLTYHPSEDFLCPEDHLWVDAGVDRGGPWGISARAADEFGAKVDLGEGDADIRLNERWSANTLTEGLRVIQETILEADTGDRPPVSPGQIHLWSVALWDAYNRLPSSPPGVTNNTAADCVKSLVEQVARKETPAEPGQPVLPPLAIIAAGERLELSPSVGCPWPADAVHKGAQAALRAATNLALIQLAAEAGESDEEG